MTASLRTRQRSFGGGPPCTVIEIRTDRLEAHRLQAPSRIRARDAAHILAVQTGMSMETLALPSLSVRATAAPAELRRHEVDTYPLLRSALSAWWERTPAESRAALLARGPSDLGHFMAVLRRRGLIAVNRLLVGGEPPRVSAMVGTLGYLRQLGHVLSRSLLLNTHFFVYDPRELDSPLAAIGDPVGMLATHGAIRQPPILRRATLTLSGCRWQVQRLGVDDLEIDLPDGSTVRPGAPGSPRLRYRGQTHHQDTPSSAQDGARPAFEVCLQGRYVSAIRSGGGLTAPHGGLVLSFEAPPPPELLPALEARPVVRYRIPRLPELITALQAGPELLRQGAVVVDGASFDREGFWTLASPDPAAPVDFPVNADRTRAARVGIGITAENGLVILAVQGTSSLSERGPDAPEGCTLIELAELLAEAGAVDALNCDGGGSAQVFSGPGVLLSSTDARGVPGALFDRPLPVAAAIG